MTGKAHDFALTVRVLRESAQYLNRNRRKKMVLSLPAKLLADENKLDSLLYDVKILNKFIGIKFVLVCEINLSKNQKTEAQEITARIDEVLARYGKGFGPLTKIARAEASLDVKGELPTKLVKNLTKSLTDYEILLVSAYAQASKATDLSTTPTDIASQLAVRLMADKLVYFLEHAVFKLLGFKVIASPEIAEMLAEPELRINPRVLANFVSGSYALSNGTHRIHFIDNSTDGGIMLELMLPDNETSAMMYNDNYEDVRKATQADVTEIHKLIENNVDDGLMRARTKRYLKRHIDSFAVVTHDETIIACASLIKENYAADTAEFCSFAVRSEYSRNAFGKLLLKFFEDKAKKEGISLLIVVTYQYDWFKGRGFASVLSTDASKILPPKRIKQLTSKRADPKAIMLKQLT